jgi:hypothetical protein
MKIITITDLALIALTTSCVDLRSSPSADVDSGHADVPNSVADSGLADVGAAEDALPSCTARRGECSPVNQEPCGAGTGCYEATLSQWYCVGAGTRTSDATCVQQSECMRGLACIQGRCMKLCCPGEPDSCADSASGGHDGDACLLTFSDFGEIRVCVPTICDVLATASNGCPSFAPYCSVGSAASPRRCSRHYTGGPLPSGSTCTFNNECATGFTCASESTDSGVTRRVCRRICLLSSSENCGIGERCYSLNIIGAPEYGVCFRN